MPLRLVHPRGVVPEVVNTESSPMEMSEIAFVSAGTVCRGRLFTPRGEEGRATLVMAHGLGGTLGAGLVGFAERLSQAGIRVVAFDYRFFGQSNGKPRQLVSIQDQLTDWQAALTFAQRLDPKAPLVLWGTSLSSGHVLTLASELPNIAAVIAQNPMVDGWTSILAQWRSVGLSQTLSVAKAGLEDLARGWFGRDPLVIPIAGESGRLAALTTPGALSGLQSIAPEHFVNAISPRVLLSLGFYRPVRRVSRIRCPVLLQLCLRDAVTPVEAGYRTAARIGALATVKTYDVGHFDIYRGPAFQDVVMDQLYFLGAHLPGSCAQ